MQLVVLSQGGLGNQLFQYQYAHFLSDSYPDSTIIFQNNNGVHDRDYALTNLFKSCQHLIKRDELSPRVLSSIRVNDRANRLIGEKYNPIQRFFLYESNAFQSDLSLSQIEGYRERLIRWPAIVRGHFQSANFQTSDCFDNNLLTAVSSRITKNRDTSQTNLVHIRRGDYLHLNSMGPLSLDYFEKVISNFKGGITLHSDADIEAFLQSSWIERVDLNTSMSTNAWDLLGDSLISKNLIGSNSSLSWWASYLWGKSNQGQQGAAIFPDSWLRDLKLSETSLKLSTWSTSEAIWEN